MNKKIWTTTIIILILVGLTYLLIGLKNSSTQDNQSILPGDNNSLVIGLQNPTSVAVLIREVSLLEPGFIVIHNNNNGQPGTVVAVSDLLQPDRYQNLSIVMDFEAGQTYFATLYGDNGNGSFNIETDTPLTNLDGEVIMTPFKISDTPIVEGAFDEKG